MMAVEVLQEEQHVQESTNGHSKRKLSTIKFPYGDLNDAAAVAKGVYEVGGSSCDWERLAAHLKQTSEGGVFRQKMLTAKRFGVVEYRQRKVVLAALGGRMCDPKQEKAAKQEAFLTVPLYRGVYDKFRGNPLPPPGALEAEMAGLGVAEKQTKKARQYFQRSADQAGFLWSGQGRVVLPAIKLNGHSPPKPQVGSDAPDTPKGKGGGDGGGRHQLIDGLIETLPPSQSEWSTEDRKNWLQAAATIFNLIYKKSDKASLAIELRDSSK
jgi:hypothetical protein